MPTPEELEKLFQAAMNGKEAPSRFGTPKEQMKAAPEAFRKKPSMNVDKAKATAPESAEPVSAVSEAAQTPTGELQAEQLDSEEAQKVLLGEQAVKSLDNTLNAELELILNEKIARDKRRKRRGRLTMLALLVCSVLGASYWAYKNPDKVEASKAVLSEMKLFLNPGEMVKKYQESLDEVAERSNQINDASSLIGADPSYSGNEKDAGFSNEMQEMMGEDGGTNTADRNKKFQEKFKSVEESGSLIKE